MSNTLKSILVFVVFLSIEFLTPSLKSLIPGVNPRLISISVRVIESTIFIFLLNNLYPGYQIFKTPKRSWTAIGISILCIYGITHFILVERIEASDWTLYLVLWLLIGTSEEFLFRGVLLQLLIKNYTSVKNGVIYSSVIFALFHFLNLFFTDSTFIELIPLVILSLGVGFLMASLLLITNSLVFVGMIHGLVNAFLNLETLVEIDNTFLFETQEFDISSIIFSLAISPILVFHSLRILKWRGV